jgi:hypothetical protein
MSQGARNETATEGSYGTQQGVKGGLARKGTRRDSGAGLLAYGVTGLIFGGQSFSSNPMNGTINGEKWLGLEVNGWSNLLFIAAGALCSSVHRCIGARRPCRSSSGSRLGAASVIALVDGRRRVRHLRRQRAHQARVGCGRGAAAGSGPAPAGGRRKKDTDHHDRIDDRPVATGGASASAPRSSASPSASAQPGSSVKPTIAPAAGGSPPRTTRGHTRAAAGSWLRRTARRARAGRPRAASASTARSSVPIRATLARAGQKYGAPSRVHPGWRAFNAR